MSRCFVFACAALVTWGSTARAADRPRIVVVPFVAGEGATETATVKFNNLVVGELKSRDGLEVAAPPQQRGPPPVERAAGSPRRTPTPETQAALDAGRKAFDELNFEEATAGLKKGLAGALAEPQTADFEVVVDGYVKLAAAYFRMGEEREAKAALFEVARLAPSFALSPGFPPVFQRELEKAKKRVEKQPRGTVSIEGPNGATAFLDGRDLGMVPALEENVAAGTHYVKVETGKGELFGQVVELKGGTVKVKAALAGGAAGKAPLAAGFQDPAIGATYDAETQGRLGPYSKAAGAEYALVGVVFRTSDTQLTINAALYSFKKNATAALPPFAFDTDVLTANTEAFKLVDEVVKRLGAFQASPLPISLTTAAVRGAVVARSNPREKDDVEVAAPIRRPVVLTPKAAETRALEQKSTVVDIEKPPPAEEPTPPPGVVKQGGGVPVWVWVVAGVAVAAGAGVGGYFAISSATRPVSGTVTATW